MVIKKRGVTFKKKWNKRGGKGRKVGKKIGPTPSKEFLSVQNGPFEKIKPFLPELTSPV